MKSELQLRKVKTAFKALDSYQDGKIIKHILQEAIRIGTPWTEEVNDLIGDVSENGIHLGRYSTKDRLMFTQKWSYRDRANQLRRLEQKVTTTTGLYKELTGQPTAIEPAPYITTNPRRNDEIRQIFALRAGASSLRADLANRHRATTSICRLCGSFDETARHVFDDCEKLTKRREKIQKRLDKYQQTYGELLSDIVLSNDITEARLRRAGLKKYTEIDQIRKDAVKYFMKHFQ